MMAFSKLIQLRIFVSILFAFGIAVSAHAQEIRTLRSIISGPNGTYGSNYPQVRCAAIYSALYNRVGTQKLAESAADYEVAIGALLTIAVLVRSKTTEISVAIDNTRKEMETIVKIYQGRMDRNYAVSGQAFFDDKLIRHDLSLCKQITESAAEEVRRLGLTK